MDLRGRPLEEKFAAYALQGLANREQARVFLKLGSDCRWMQLDYTSAKPGMEIWSADATASFSNRFESVEDMWMNILDRSRAVVFQKKSLEELLPLLREQVKGWILYDNIAEDCCPAATLAGIEDALPVTEALRAKWESLGLRLPTVRDYRQVRATFGAKEDRRLASHRWAIENLLPRCRKDGAVSRVWLYNHDAHDTIVDVDQAVQNRWFVYDLDHSAFENQTGHVKDLARNPPDKELLDRIVSAIEPFSIVYGWGRPGEDSFIRSLNRHRLVGECSGVPNNSFFAKLPCARREFRQPRPHIEPAQVKVEPKIYITFMVNEGDSIKAMNSLGGFGCWQQPERGRIPINWGIEPNLIQSHPALLSYYYRTATTNDYFFAPASGWGYSHPGFLPADSLMGYAEKVRAGMAMADERYIDIWWNASLLARQQLQPFLKAAGVRGLTDWDGSQQAVIYTAGGVTVIKSNHYYTYKSPPADFANLLIEDMRDVKPPWFVVIYGALDHGTPYRFYELAKRLPADRFKIVALDEFFGAAEKARPQVEGRVWRPGPNAPKGVAP